MHFFYWRINHCLIPARLERDVVIVEVVACIRIGFIVVTDLCRSSLWRDAAGAFAATAEHVHLVSNNLSEHNGPAIIAGEFVVTDGALYAWHCDPLCRYSAAISPSFPKNLTRCHSVRSWSIALSVLAFAAGR